MENPFNSTVAITPENSPFEGVDLGEMERTLFRPRSFISAGLTGLVTLLTLSAMIPLFSVLFALGVRGLRRLNWEAFTHLPPAGLDEGGGFGNAVLGTLVMVVLATLITVPIGVFGGVYLAELGPRTKLASWVRFCAKVLTGFPSVLAGVFVYGTVVLLTRHYFGFAFSAIAGSIALSILMVPTVLLTAEDAIKMVPSKMKEAAIGMGCTPTQVITSVMLPTAMPGILTGLMLAVARAAGETAPLLFTALFRNDWMQSLNEPIASLAVLIYNFSGQTENMQELAWAAALVLVLLVLAFNLAGQYLSSRSK
ncbi:MAG: phosphate ABC transporter permease PstA [Planctomycetota bacterium]|jgi:phosphate transport system permease protein